MDSMESVRVAATMLACWDCLQDLNINSFVPNIGRVGCRQMLPLITTVR